MPLSRQRLWQIKRRNEGKCTQCSEPAKLTTNPASISKYAKFCEECGIKDRELRRRRDGAGRRNLGAKSYRKGVTE